MFSFTRAMYSTRGYLNLKPLELQSSALTAELSPS